MGSVKERKYTGYKSFQYLEPGVDFTVFKESEEIGRVEPYLVPLSDSQEKRVETLHQDCIVVAFHDHSLKLPADLAHLSEWSRLGRYATAFEGLSASCIDVFFDNLWAGLATITSKGGWHFEDVVFDLGMRLCDIAHQDFVKRAECVADIMAAHREGTMAFVPAIESCTPIENELDRIDVLYGLGIRMMGITYNEANLLGSGIKEERDGGLSYFGRQAVKRMNRLGMAIDLSHTGDVTCLDTISTSQKPVFISHSGARGVWNSKRMKPDEVIKACAQKGGVIGIEASPLTTFSRGRPEMDIESVMDHFTYCVELVGLEHVCFGLDVLYGDHVGLHEVLGGHMAMSQVIFDIDSGEVPEKVAYVKGLENPTEGYNNIVRWLVKHDYSDDEIRKVVGGNVLRALQEVWD
jgi:membrane dipeptidase